MKNSSVDLTQRLDQLEQSLPPLPAKSVAFGRAAVRRTNDVVTSVASDVARRVDRVFRTTRTSADTTIGQARAASGAASDTAGTQFKRAVGQARSAAERTAKVAETSTKQAVGQARTAASRTGKAASAAARQTAGQARAEAEQVGDAVDRESQALVDDATDAVDPGSSGRSGAYEDWTKDELYARAQELDIDGRSQMTKSDLIEALRSA